MTAKRDERQYVRVYYEQLEEEFPLVWRDAALRGDWLLLLARADKMYPAAPELPRAVCQDSIDRLVAAKILKVLDDFRYQVRGYAKARAARQATARAAADVRWGNSTGNADASASAPAPAMPSPSPRPNPRPVTETEGEEAPNLPPPPSRRSAGTSPRQTSSSPRDQGGAPRQLREATKRGPTRLGEILAETRIRAAAAGGDGGR